MELIVLGLVAYGIYWLFFKNKDSEPPSTSTSTRTPDHQAVWNAALPVPPRTDYAPPRTSSAPPQPWTSANTQGTGFSPRVFTYEGAEESADTNVSRVGVYHPWRGGRNPFFNNYSAQILDLKRGAEAAICTFVSRVEPLIEKNVVIAVVPPHTTGSSVSGIQSVARRLAMNGRVDGTGCLVRVAPIAKLSDGGSRDEGVHFASIKVANDYLVRGRTVLLLDDVMTTGGSLKACRALLVQAGARKVGCLALAGTFPCSSFIGSLQPEPKAASPQVSLPVSPERTAPHPDTTVRPKPPHASSSKSTFKFYAALLAPGASANSRACLCDANMELVTKDGETSVQCMDCRRKFEFRTTGYSAVLSRALRSSVDCRVKPHVAATHHGTTCQVSVRGDTTTIRRIESEVIKAGTERADNRVYRQDENVSFGWPGHDNMPG